MAHWTLAKALATLRSQVDSMYPKRSKRSDGSIGDAKHSARKSDHNRNVRGYVNAVDITHDPRGGFDSYKFAEHLRNTRDPRISYVISNGKIFSSSVAPWQWRKYNGANKHDHHVHISVRQTGETSGGLWQMPPRVTAAQGFAAVPEVPPDADSLPDATDSEDRCFWEDVIDKGTEEDTGEVDQKDNGA